jgi:hypothetical protein
MTLRNSQDGSFNYYPEPKYVADICDDEIAVMQIAERDCKDIVSLIAKAFIARRYDITAGDIEMISDAISNVISDQCEFINAKHKLENHDLHDDVFINLGENTQDKILADAKNMTESQVLKNAGLIRISNNPQTLAVLPPFETIK